MPKTYTKAESSIHSLIASCVDRWHPVLKACEVTFDALLESDIDDESGEERPSLKLHGYPCAAVVKVTSLKQRALGQADVLITIDAATWDRLSIDECEAVIDHELEHVGVLADQKGGHWLTMEMLNHPELPARPKSDDLGRPRLKLRLHDWQLGGFAIVAKRHGQCALEVQEIRAAFDVHGQGLLFGEADPKAAHVEMASKALSGMVPGGTTTIERIEVDVEVARDGRQRRALRKALEAET